MKRGIAKRVPQEHSKTRGTKLVLTKLFENVGSYILCAELPVYAGAGACMDCHANTYVSVLS